MTTIKNWINRVIGGLLITLSLALTFQWSKLRRLLRVNSLFSPEWIVKNFSDMKGMFFHTPMEARVGPPTPLPEAPRPLVDHFTFRGERISVEGWKAARMVTGMVVLKDGALVHESYGQGTQPEDLRISWSVAKSFLSAAFGIAVGDGLIPDLDAQVTDYVPSLRGSAYDGVTLRNLLNMSSGVDFNEDYLDFHSDINRMGRVLALGRSMDGFAASLKRRAWAPGSLRKYVSIDTHVIGMVLRAITGQPVPEYITDKLLRPMGLEANPYYLTDGDGVAFVLGGLNLTTRDYARFGLLFAQDGRLGDRQIVPQSWVRASTSNNAPPPAPDIADLDEGLIGYGYQWWIPPISEEDGRLCVAQRVEDTDPLPHAPERSHSPCEFFALGIYGQYVYVNRALRVVIALNSADRGFKEGDGRVTLTHLAMMRAIALGLS